MRERIGAFLGRGRKDSSPPVPGEQREAPASRVLRRTLAALQAVNDPAISDVEGGRRAAEVAAWYASAGAEERRAFWLLLCERFAPDIGALDAARAAYEAASGTPGEARAEVALRKALTPPRTRLLQRFAAFPGGLRFLIGLRAELLPLVKSDARLLALEAELEGLFSAWFDVGLLELRRISWNSPAALVEKLIEYEAVHGIRSWTDAKNRLDEDRRCYGFFHPGLPGEPLIFVEVALLAGMGAGIVPLLDETAAAVDLKKATTAIFYSINSTQRGLNGVSFGDSLIKRVVEILQEEFPRLKTFATLSPMPGLRTWVTRHAVELSASLSARQRQALASDLGIKGELGAPQLLAALDGVAQLTERAALARWLLRAAARYLGATQGDAGRPVDAVARFHLGNGARVERLNWLADPSPKGLRQSWGLMVNYLYDPKRLDKHRAMLARGKIPLSGAVENLQD
ncbi:MAG: Malonyl-CoA decarboxylase [Burkholderiaceae bacterium]|nr:MAG: Malonyl-CoA decarboxylase [Burkholderiaceae bacterium]